MARGHDVLRQLAAWPSILPQTSLTMRRLKMPGPSRSVCKSCLSSLRHQRLASTAPSAALNQEPLPADHVDTSPRPSSRPSTQPSYQIQAAVILSRPPTLTRDLTPFEKAYFLYQKRLNERLALPFTRYFYYQRGSPGDANWKRQIKERQTPARDIGVYNAYSKEGWNDELLLGAKESEPEDQIEALVRDAQIEAELGEEGEGMVKKEEVVEKPMPRVTEADKVGDMKSLNRALTRTLYLVVKSGKEGKDGGRWGFPSSVLVGRESLHTAAERILVQSSGPNMNTWVIGNVPIGHQVIHSPVDQTGNGQLGVKRFFMKARIMAGQANLNGNKFGLEDFKWLSREEIKNEFQYQDWHAVRNILADR